MESLENSFKAENRRRISEAKRLNAEAVDGAIDVYRRAMKDILEENTYLTKEMFRPLEKESEKTAKNHFKQNCSAGDLEFKKNFGLDFEQKLKETKEYFKEQNRLKCERVEINTEKLANTSVEEYNQRMENMFDSFTSVEELTESHEEFRQKCLAKFNFSSPYKDQQFLSPYLNQLHKDINKSYEDLKNKFNDRLERLHNFFNSQVINAKEAYIQV